MSGDPPTLSILVPAYNAERWLAEAIDSALAQTYRAVEVVVVDDGSTDATADIAAGYGERIVLVRQENRGLAGARNTALRHARGALIGLLDADDAWEPTRAERTVAWFEAHPDGAIVTTDAWIVAETTLTERRYYRDHLGRDFPAPAAQLAAIARHNFVFVAAVARREVFDRVGAFEESLRRAEDYDLWCRALLAGERIGLIDEPLARYRVRSDSLSADRVAQWEAHLRVVERHLEAFVAAGVPLDPTALYDLARRAETQGEVARASRCYLLAARNATGPGRRVRLAAAALRARRRGR